MRERPCRRSKIRDDQADMAAAAVFLGMTETAAQGKCTVISLGTTIVVALSGCMITSCYFRYSGNIIIKGDLWFIYQSVLTTTF